MIFKREYIFETKATYRKRMMAKVFFFGLIPLFFFIAFISIIFRFSFTSNIATEAFLKLHSPDAIVVFTGDEGRIPWALNIVEKYPSTKLIISGVFNKNTTENLISRYMGTVEKIGPEQIDLDYFANNTVENALFTVRYLKKHPEYKKVLIVSHDYHLLRIKMAIAFIKDSNSLDETSFYYYGLPSPRDNWRTFKLFSKEVLKFWKAFAFLLLWDSDSNET